MKEKKALVKLWLCVSFWLASLAMALEWAPFYGVPDALLRSGFGARIQGLGQAGVALCDEPLPAFWNPAAITVDNRPVLRFGGSILSYGRREANAAVCHAINPKTAFGVSWLYRGDPNVPDINGDEENTGTLSSSLNLIHAGGSYRLNRIFTIGTAFGIYKRKEFDYDCQGVGLLDLGLRYHRQSISWGLNLKNIPWLSAQIPWQVNAGTSQYNAQSDLILPMELKCGATKRLTLFHRPVLFALEEDFFYWEETKSPYHSPIRKRKFWYNTHHAGAETQILPRLAIRAGYDNGRFPFGIGIKDIIQNTRLDYTFSLERNGMGFNHTMEWVWRF